MIKADDQPPSPVSAPNTLKQAISKLDNKHELLEYVEHLTSFNAHHLFDVTNDLRQRLMLQGLDEDDMRSIHDYLEIEFDGDLIKTDNKEVTLKKADLLNKLIRI